MPKLFLYRDISPPETQSSSRLSRNLPIREHKERSAFVSGRSSRRWHTTTGYVSSPCPNVLARQAACSIRIAPSRDTGTWAPPSPARAPAAAPCSTEHSPPPPTPRYLAASSLARLLPPFHPSFRPSILHPASLSLARSLARSLRSFARPACLSPSLSPSRSLSLSPLSFRARLTVTAQDDEQSWGGRLLPAQRLEGRGRTNGEKWRNGKNEQTDKTSSLMP